MTSTSTTGAHDASADVPVVAYEVDLVGAFVGVSPAFTDVLGWRAEELLGTFAPSLVHPEDRGRLVSQSRGLLSTGGDLDPVWRVRHASGEYRWYRVEAQPTTDASGTVTGLHAELVDVDQAEAARTALVASERRYRLLVQNSSDVVAHDVGGILRWISPSVTGLLGWTPDELIGRPSADLRRPDEIARGSTFRTRVAEGSVAATLTELRHKDGHYVAVDAAARADGNPDEPGMVVTLRDATARVATETALRQSEASYRLLAENAADVVTRTDCDGIIEWISPSVESVLGVAPAELVGSSLLERAHPDDVAARAEAVARTDLGETTYFETRYRHADGHYVWLGISLRPALDPSGVVVGRLGSARDVSREVESRRALKRQEAEFRVLAENAADIVFRLDNEGRFTWLSPSTATVLGYLPEDYIGHDPDEWVHPDDVAARLEVIHGMGADGRSSYEARFRRGDGSYMWLAVTGRPLLDEDGRAVGRIGSARDVTREVEALEALRERESDFRLLAENAADIVFRTSLDTTLDWVSPSITSLLGWAGDEIAGTSLLELLHPDDRAAAIATIAETTAGRAVSFEARARRKTGDYRWMAVRAHPLLDQDGHVLEVIGGARDISESVAAREALAASEEMFRSVMESSTAGMAVVGLDLTFRAVNPALCRLLQRDVDWFGVHLATELAWPEHRSPAGREAVNHFGTGDASVTDEVGLTRADGAGIWVQRTVVLMRDPEGDPAYYVVQLQDITAERELEFQTIHDSLTGLRNRTWILDILEEELRVAHRGHRSVGVLFIDLDNFKVVNDSLGHPAGDEVLASVARRLVSAMRPGDHIGRFGGDEFVVVIPEVDEVPDLERICERVLAAITPPLDVQGHRIAPTASIGVAVSDSDSSAQSLLRDADSALYRAKSAGKHRWHFADEAMHAQAVARLTTEDELRRAIDEHQLVVHYQPIVRLTDREVVGHEALVRWQHPERGLVPPLDFLPIAEESGLIVDIGDEVLELVCRKLSERPDLAAVSVNMSPVQISRAGWRERFVARLREHHVDPNRVVVEVTETAVLGNLEDVADQLAQLRDLGIGVHVDDFGTGYSSIALLRDLPITGLKLDMSFTRRLTGDGGTPEVLAEGLARLGRGLGLVGIAEGVETEEQAALLVELGWSHGQGWLFGRPVPDPA